MVLTNGGKQQTQELLERGGLAAHVETVFSTADVRAYKPDPRPYRHVARALGVDEPGRLALVAAHGWDVLGARACGWEAVWVERLELVWPFPGPPPDRRAADLAGAAAAVARQA